MDTTAKANIGCQKLLALDRKYRLDYEDKTTIAVQDGITCIMEDFVQKIGETEPVFKGNLLTCGSIKNKTKIGKPDEIDFGFHWDLSDSRASMITDIVFHIPESKVSNTSCDVLVRDEVKMYFYIDEAYQGFDTIECFQLKDLKYKRIGFHVYEIKEIQKHFTKVVDYIMEQLILPQGWTHGGYNSPEYSGYRGTGASTMFQFIYNDKLMTQPLFVSVDFVMLIELRECYKGDPFKLIEINSSDPTWLQTFLTKNNCYDKVWLKISQGNSLTDHSLAMRMLLQSFDMESPLKIVIRVVKCLSMLAFACPQASHLQRSIDDYGYAFGNITLTEIVRRKMLKAQKRKIKLTKVFYTILHQRPLHEFQTHDICKPEGERFADIGEHIDCPPYVKSYTMLVLIVSMFCSKALKHPDLELCDIWKLDDIDSIVTDVLTLLLKIFESSVAALKDADGRELLGKHSAISLYTEQAVVDHIKQMRKVKAEICEN